MQDIYLLQCILHWKITAFTLLEDQNKLSTAICESLHGDMDTVLRWVSRITHLHFREWINNTEKAGRKQSTLAGLLLSYCV